MPPTKAVSKAPSSPVIRKETLKDLYPEIAVSICKGDKAVTMQQAMDLLGWENETQTVKFGEDYLFTDVNKRKIRCFNNTKNRPLNYEWCLTLAQDILNRKWRFNCETIIIGKSGQILSGQHRLIALVIACQMWQNAEAGSHWRVLWETEPTLESLIAFGAEEGEAFTQTLDNVRSRTLADTLYTSNLFKTWKPRDKKNVVRVAESAVRLLFDRTGMANSKYISKLTNSEAYEFLNRHLRVLDGVKHIYTEDIKGSIQKCMTMGYAAGMLYLQAACEDSVEEYQANTPPDESTLGLARWDDALKFWIGFSISKRFDTVKKLLLSCDDDDVRISMEERLGILVKTWDAFRSGRPLDEANVAVLFEVDDQGARKLLETPTLGGIDTGGVAEKITEEEADAVR